MKLTVVTLAGKNSTMTASDSVFGQKPNGELVAQAVRVYLANQRQGTSATKTRSDVARTTKKWFKQKGTGNARHGARSSHIFVGGGVAFGPKSDQNWALALPKKMKRKALAVALSMQVSKLVVSEELASLTGKTKEAAVLISKITAPDARRVLVLINDVKPEVARSLRNLPNVLVSHVSRVNIFEVMNATHLVIAKDAVAQLEERLA